MRPKDSLRPCKISCALCCDNNRRPGWSSAVISRIKQQQRCTWDTFNADPGTLVLVWIQSNNNNKLHHDKVTTSTIPSATTQQQQKQQQPSIVQRLFQQANYDLNRQMTRFWQSGDPRLYQDRPRLILTTHDARQEDRPLTISKLDSWKFISGRPLHMHWNLNRYGQRQNFQENYSLKIYLAN